MTPQRYQTFWTVLLLIVLFAIGLQILLPQFFPFSRLDIPPDMLFMPLLITVLTGLLLTTVFSYQSETIRTIIYLLVIFFTMRYLFWRVFFTLNLNTPLNGFLSLLLLGAELLMLLPNMLANYMMLVSRTNHRDKADALAQHVEAGKFVPSVDVFIATYNEAEDMLERTIIGCQALDYPKKKIYVLDDGRRKNIEALTERLGCYYFTRPDNRHYKAGNLNNAFWQTESDLIVFFDADFVPCRDFLNQTVGFFQDNNVALLQTPQHFYNADPIESNLGLRGALTNEQAVFFGLIQPGRDLVNSVICCGTSFLARRKVLEEIGGIPTQSITEDYVTSLACQALGYRVIYLDKILSAGDAPASMSFFINQRLRWCIGVLQTLFTEYNAFKIKGLSLMQHYYHLLTHINWLMPVIRLVAILMPLTFLIFGCMPLKADISQVVYYFLPIYCLNLVVSNWLHSGKRSPFWTDVYDAVMMIPLAVSWAKTLKSPFGKGFSVTPKPLSTSKIFFQWDIALPLMIIFMLYVVGFIIQYQNWSLRADNSSTLINVFWGVYNCIIMWVAILTCIDIPQDRYYVKHQVEKRGLLTMGERSIPFMVHTLSEKAACISLPGNFEPVADVALTFTLPDGDLLDFPVRSLEKVSSQWKLVFSNLSLSEKRLIIDYLYCQPGQWEDKPFGDSHYTWNFIRSIFRLYPLTNVHS